MNFVAVCCFLQLSALVLATDWDLSFEEKWEAYSHILPVPVNSALGGATPNIPIDSVISQAAYGANRFEPHTHLNGILKPVGFALFILEPENPLEVRDQLILQGIEELQPIIERHQQRVENELCVFSDHERDMCPLYQYLHSLSPLAIKISENYHPDVHKGLVILPRLRYYLYLRLAQHILETQDTGLREEELWNCLLNYMRAPAAERFAAANSADHFQKAWESYETDADSIAERESFLEGVIEYVRGMLTASPNESFEKAYNYITDIKKRNSGWEQNKLYYKLIVQQLRDDGVSLAQISAPINLIPGFDILYESQQIESHIKRSPRIDSEHAMKLCLKMFEADQCQTKAQQMFTKSKPQISDLRAKHMIGSIFHSPEVRKANMQIVWLVHADASRIIGQEIKDSKPWCASYNYNNNHPSVQEFSTLHGLVQENSCKDIPNEKFQFLPLFQVIHGIDFAGAESYTSFNTMPMQDSSARNDYVSNHRFTSLYNAVKEYMAEARRQNWLFHIHSGEGSVAYYGDSNPGWCSDPKKLYDSPRQLILSQFKYVAADGSPQIYREPIHYTTARRNIDRTVSFIETLLSLPPHSSPVPLPISFRLGHATHISAHSVDTILNLGIDADVNLGSNVATGSIIPVGLSPYEEQSLKATYSLREGVSLELEPAFFLTHDVLQLMTRQVAFSIGSDGSGLEKTTIKDVDKSLRNLRSFIRERCGNEAEALKEVYRTRRLEYLTLSQAPDECEDPERHCPSQYDFAALCVVLTSSRQNTGLDFYEKPLSPLALNSPDLKQSSRTPLKRSARTPASRDSASSREEKTSTNKKRDRLGTPIGKWDHSEEDDRYGILSAHVDAELSPNQEQISFDQRIAEALQLQEDNEAKESSSSLLRDSSSSSSRDMFDTDLQSNLLQQRPRCLPKSSMMGTPASNHVHSGLTPNIGGLGVHSPDAKQSIPLNEAEADGKKKPRWTKEMDSANLGEEVDLAFRDNDFSKGLGKNEDSSNFDRR